MDDTPLPYAQTSEWFTRLIRIVYRLQPDDQYQDLTDIERLHKKTTQKEKRDTAKLVSPKAPAVTLASVIEANMMLHVRETVTEGTLISLNGAALNAMQIRTVSSELSLRSRKDLEPMRTLDLDADGEGPPVANNSANMFFQVIHKTPGQMRTIPVLLAAGGRMPHNAIAIVKHEAHRSK